MQVKATLACGGDIFMQKSSPDHHQHELTTSAVSRLIGVSVPTVRSLAEKGELPGWRIGARYKFSRESVNEFLKRSARPAVAEAA